MITRQNFSVEKYLVIGPENTQGRPVSDIVRVAVAAGFTCVQIRSKIASSGELIRLGGESAAEIARLGKSDEVCPAVITEAQKASIGYWTERIYRHLGCTGLVRMDYIMTEDGVYFLEINATPGMTRMSLVPKMVRVAGIDISDFFTELIESAR